MFWILLGPAVRNPAACIKEESISRLSVRRVGALTFPALSGEPVWVGQFAGAGASCCHRSTRHVIYHHSQCHFTRPKFSGCWRCVSSCPPFRLALRSWMDQRFDLTLCGAWRNWLLILLRHFLQWKVCCAFHWTAQMFSFFSISSFTLCQDKDEVSGKASPTVLQWRYCLPKMNQLLPFWEITRTLLTSILDKSMYEAQRICFLLPF